METIICKTAQEFHAEVEKWQKKGASPVILGRWLIAHGESVAELRNPNWGGSRGGGRPKNDRNIMLSVRITQRAMDNLNSFTKNKAEFVDRLLTDYSPMTNLINELKTRHNSVYYGDSPLFHALYLHEAFEFFDEIRFSPLIGDKPKAFTIHRNDIEEGGKFYDFRNYSVLKMGREFACDVSFA